jgi:5-methylcytosine-specific restriction endonuclease McrA
MNAFSHAKRRVLTVRERAKLFLDGGGRCACCGRHLKPGDKWTADHIIARENGGTEDDDNFQVLCEWCDKPKTAADHGRASDIRRKAAKHFVPTGERKKQGRPLGGTIASGWKKPFSGPPVRR